MSHEIDPKSLKLEEPVPPFRMSWSGWLLLGLLVFMLVFFKMVLPMMQG